MKNASDWEAYRSTLNLELGEDLAGKFVDDLRHACNDSPQQATEFFHRLGLMWAPVIQAWSHWVNQRATGTIAIVLRDAKPLIMLDETSSWEQLHLNRLTCGIEDELSRDGEDGVHPLLRDYLKQHGCDSSFTFVDSGCYGSVVLALHNMGISFLPLFFFSKNPHIPGFLNDLGFSEEEGTILNDSLECGFPHRYQRPRELVRTDEVVHIVLKEADRLSTQFGWAALCGVGMTPSVEHADPRENVQRLLELSEKARTGIFTGILPHVSPEWSKKEAFLAHWPKKLCWT